MRTVFLFVSFMMGISGLMAQELVPDTVLFLDGVTVFSSRTNRFAKGQVLFTPDSLNRSDYAAATLGDLINGMTSTYSRNYGQGTLSTVSFRGTSANHTGLLWNGVRISPPNIGYVDLSLVQQSFFNTISFLFGGASPMFGSGNIGGSIQLENRPVFEKSGYDANIALSAGSFNTYSLESGLKFYRKNFYSHTAISVLNSLNNFFYKNSQDKNEKLPHAEIFRSGIIQDMAVQLPGKQYIMGSAWFQYADREMPPTLTEASSEAVQTDRSWRTMLIWKDFNVSNNLEARIAYFNEYTRYDDPPADVFSTIVSQSVVGAFESTWAIGDKDDVFSGAQYTYEFADLVNYDSPQHQQTMALYASYRHIFPVLQWQAGINGRQEFLSGFQAPFLFSFGAEGKIWKFLSARFSISRNFRAPTLNERFWQPGGNPDLKPEKSWNEELGLVADKQFLHGLMKIGLTAFNSNVSDWILWLPGNSYWSVENAQEVWSRGIEFSGEQNYYINKLTLSISESYTYLKSTNEKKLFELDASYKKQLIYTPSHRLSIRTGALYHGYSVSLRGNFTGLVYTSKDNSESLPAYFLLDLSLSKTFNLKGNHPLTIHLNLNNILNKDYQAVPYRPMPGINGLLTVKVALGKSAACPGELMTRDWQSAVSSQQSAVGSWPLAK